MALSEETNNKIRKLLNDELERRINKNPKYSLRSFSAHLGFEPSFLSKILSGKKNITDQSYNRIIEKLGLSYVSPDKFNDLEKVNQIEIEQFKIISEWYHFAILEIIQTNRFKNNEEWIAKQLGLHLQEVRSALKRLESLGYIKIENKTIKALRPQNTTLANKFTTAALQNLQKQILNQAIEAIDNTQFEERIQISMTTAIDSDLLPEAKDKVRKFIRELTSFLESGKKRDRVYQISISTFPVQKKEDNA